MAEMNGAPNIPPPPRLEPSMELLGMAVGNGRTETGEPIKVLELTVKLEIPMNSAAARSMSEALAASGIIAQRQMPPESPRG